MIEIRPYKAADLKAIDRQPGQEHELAAEGTAEALEASFALTVLSGGKPMACMGISEIWSGRAFCWALMDRSSGRVFKAIHRVAKTTFDNSPYRRIEAYVKADFMEGHRWMGMLGFKKEALIMRKFIGEHDYSLYARVR